MEEPVSDQEEIPGGLYASKMNASSLCYVTLISDVKTDDPPKGYEAEGKAERSGLHPLSGFENSLGKYGGLLAGR